MKHTKPVPKSNHKMSSLGKHTKDLSDSQYYDQDDDDNDNNNDDYDDDDDEDNDDGDDDSDDDSSIIEDVEVKDKLSMDVRDIPIFQRLSSSNNFDEHELNDTEYRHHNKRFRNHQSTVDEGEGEGGVSNMNELKVKTKRAKNAPLVMRSNRPVSRLRIDRGGPVNAANKRRDPRYLYERIYSV